MDLTQLPPWLVYTDVFGTIGAFALFGLLFWRGQIVSKGTVDRITAIYEAQAKALSNGFLAKLEELMSHQVEATDRQRESVDVLVASIKESTVEARASREKMQEVVGEIRISLTAISVKQNGVTAAPRRRSVRPH